MFFPTATRKFRQTSASRLTLALALGFGVTLTAGAIESPVHAQRAANNQEQAAQPAYSEAFVAAYQPAAELANANPRDGAAMRALVPSITAAASTPDDRMAAGQFILATGTTINDPALQLQGLSMMFESGKVSAANAGRLNFAAGQIAYQTQDYGQAREFLQAALDAGYTENDPRLLLVETHLQQNDAAGALNYLDQIVNQQIAAGQVPPRNYLQRGMSAAYNAQMSDQALRYANLSAEYYPDAETWGNVIGLVRASANLNDDETLDLLRLQRKTNAFRDGQEYLNYIELADPRRLPSEVVQVINEGYSSGLLARDNTFASEALAEAQSRQGQLQADLAALERDANASGARLATVMAAGNVFLNAEQPAKAEQFYQKALTMPGVDTVTARNRLGIAQVNQGKFAEAAATFNQAQGDSSAVSRLWATYAEQQQGGAASGG